MAGNDLWKYCTDEQVKAALRSFKLLSGIPLDADRELACLYAVSNHIERHYQTAQIPKKSGGVRRLLVPDDLLCRIQKNILHNVLCEFSAAPQAAAYQKGKSAADNARPHIGAVQIVKLDIRDFFESISYSLVYQFAFPETHFPPAIRRMLTELCCYRDYLPQGAPTSPAVSNLVMKPFDRYMGEWCEQRGICYTRYSDDLTFSWKDETDPRTLIRKVRSFLQVYGFELNQKKTRILTRNVRQSVTGIVVNDKMQLSREYRRSLRQEIYYCRKYGVEEHVKTRYTGASCAAYLQSLLGKVNYVCLINPEDQWFQEAKEDVKSFLKALKAPEQTDSDTHSDTRAESYGIFPEKPG